MEWVFVRMHYTEEVAEGVEEGDDGGEGGGSEWVKLAEEVPSQLVAGGGWNVA